MNWFSSATQGISLIAQAEDGGASSSVTSILLGPLVMAVIFSVLGVVVLLLSFLVIARILPFSIRKEIEEDENTALAIVIGSMILGLSIIIAAAMVG